MSVSPDTRTYPPQNPLTMPGRLPGGLAPFSDQNAERRVVTILFCDVVGSSAMAEVLDPEEWADVMSETFEYLIRPIERFDGTVTRLMGDAVLALFGAPRAHEDDPQRAILAGLEIIENIQPLRERIKRRHGFDFNVRVGINTGLVVVGAFGADELVEYTAMGDAINVAARLQEMAEPGTIRIGATTHRLTALSFDFEPFGATDVRGKRETEMTYRVVGRTQGALSGLGRLWDSNGRDMPFTGRAAELARIKQAIDELRFEGRGHIIAISGEAGIGKTRLVDEVVDYVRSRPADDGGMSIAVLENRVNPYEGSRPYAGLQARFRKVFGINENDSSQVVREKFIERSSQFPAEFRERAAQVIQRVMALDIDGLSASREIAGLEPEEFKSELATVVTQIVRGWNPDGAFMLVGEDYQWGDYASLEIVSHLYQLLHERPVLFLCTFRPDPNAPMMRLLPGVREEYADYMIEIALEPLASTDAEALVRSLIACESEDAEKLRQIILARSEGNPLFIEEIVQTLVDQGALEPNDNDPSRWKLSSQAASLQLSIPTSLQALLLERIDRLPTDARRTLQQAAVLGRYFSRRVLRDVAQINGNLDNHLETLSGLDLIRGGEGGTDDSLAFRHALIQETAYNTILLRHRREFHRRAAESIERLYADRQLEYASDIGLHYERAGDERGIEWLTRAANQAQSVYESDAVVDYATKAIELAGSTDSAAPAEAHRLRGRAHDMLGNFEAARDDLQMVVNLAREREDQDLEWDALLQLGNLWSASDYGRAGLYVQDGLALARSLGDDRKLAHSLNRSGNWRVNVGDPGNARRDHQEALAIFKRLGDEAGLAETLDLFGLASYLSADFSASAASFRESIPMFRERGDNRNLSSSLAMLALSGGGLDSETSLPAEGTFEEWLAHAREAIEIARSIHWRAGESFAHLVLGNAYMAHGEPGQALEAFSQSLAVAQEIDHKQWSVAATIALGSIAIDLYDYDRACEYLTDGLERARALGSAYWTSSAIAELVNWQLAHGEYDYAARLLNEAINVSAQLDSAGLRKLWFGRAKLALALGDTYEALEIIDRLIDTAPGSNPDRVIPDLALLRGQALAQSEQYDEARAEFQAAREQAERTNNRFLLLRIHAAIADLHRQTGQPTLADHEERQTRALVQQIADRLPAGTWRTEFLSGTDALLVNTAV